MKTNFMGLTVGDTVHLDPDALPSLRVITEDEARVIAVAKPTSRFVVTKIGRASVSVNNPKK